MYPLEALKAMTRNSFQESRNGFWHITVKWAMIDDDTGTQLRPLKTLLTDGTFDPLLWARILAADEVFFKNGSPIEL